MYSVYTCNIIFYMGLSRQEWVNGIGKGLDDDFPIRQVLSWGLICCCAQFSQQKKIGLVDTVYVHASYYFSMTQGEQKW
jgi:hypothetical protein